MNSKTNKDKVNNALEEFLKEIKPYTWKYEYMDGTIYEVKFKNNDLMHLLGLNKLKKYEIMRSKNTKGLGKICFSHLKKGKIKDSYISKDKNRRLIERKIINFPKLKYLLGDLDTMHFYFNKKLVPCKINAEYVLYNPVDGTHCHFGVVETGNKLGRIPKICSPVTWFIEEDRPDMYIKNQVPAKLKSIIKIENSTGKIVFSKTVEETIDTIIDYELNIDETIKKVL